MTRRGILQLTPFLLKRLLKLPDDVYVTNAYWDIARDSFLLQLATQSQDKLYEIPEGATIPFVEPQYKIYPDPYALRPDTFEFEGFR